MKTTASNERVRLNYVAAALGVAALATLGVATVAESNSGPGTVMAGSNQDSPAPTYSTPQVPAMSVGATVGVVTTTPPGH